MAFEPLEDDAMCFCCGAKNPIGLKLAFEDTPEGRAVLAYGGQVRAITFIHDRSTTAMLKRIRMSRGTS